MAANRGKTFGWKACRDYLCRPEKIFIKIGFFRQTNW